MQLTQSGYQPLKHTPLSIASPSNQNSMTRTDTSQDASLTFGASRRRRWRLPTVILILLALAGGTGYKFGPSWLQKIIAPYSQMVRDFRTTVQGLDKNFEFPPGEPLESNPQEGSTGSESTGAGQTRTAGSASSQHLITTTTTIEAERSLQAKRPNHEKSSGEKVEKKRTERPKQFTVDVPLKFAWSPQMAQLVAESVNSRQAHFHKLSPETVPLFEIDAEIADSYWNQLPDEWKEEIKGIETDIQTVRPVDLATHWIAPIFSALAVQEFSDLAGIAGQILNLETAQGFRIDRLSALHEYIKTNDPDKLHNIPNPEDFNRVFRTFMGVLSNT